MQEFGGRVAVITGGASGMGRAFADRFAAAGMKIVIGDIEEPELARAVDELKAAGADAIGVRADVSQMADVQALRDRALEAFGAVHVVCNNAGVAGGSVIDSPLEMWQWVLGVNLWGVIHGCNVFLPLLLDQDEGHIVNTASIAGLGGAAGLGVYCTSKFAVVGLSESLHHDLMARQSRVGVSVLCPGFVQTRIFESHRNMPDHVRAVAPAPVGGDDDVQRTVVGMGIPAADAAEAVFAAIEHRRFFVLPHERAARQYTQQRLEWMQGGEPAAFDIESLIRP
jgi:NAD(P)-dependent dehydrogenase (short-subunit alcohol dehydrogenase family)